MCRSVVRLPTGGYPPILASMVENRVGPNRAGGFRLVESLVDGGAALTLRRWVVQTLGDGWEAVIEVEAIASSEDAMREQLRVASVRIEKRDGEAVAPLTQIYRRLRLRDALRFAEQAARVPFGIERAPRPLLADEALAPRRPGRRGHGPAHYAELAAAYIEGAQQGRTVQDVAEDYRLTAKALRSGLRKAEGLGLVTAATNGRMGGRELTREGRAVMRSLERSATGAEHVAEPDRSDPFWRAADNGRWRALEGDADAISG